LRDDFLFHCQKHEALSPVFSELSPLGTLSASALRRALVQPALACGYRFEDDALVDEMVNEVSRERGVLPLLAFAASRLWEKRDREKGLLTREAYEEIGGVGGALAQHAEETLSRIGEERTPLVRELFRNLVTAQGTRASRGVDELLSIFAKEDERKAAEEVLRELIAARLLTSYEDSVEIIHESLLSAWPRLVRWQAQDADGVVLRDQLRQTAQVWEDRGRPDDLLWTGSSYREFALWRERYAGGLTTTEDAFADAARKLAGRTRRRRRFAVAALVAALATVALVMTSLWRRSEVAALRAEASKLLTLGQLEFTKHPTAALAYAIKSLELADTEEARLFALRVVQSGPIARFAPGNPQPGLEGYVPAFSPGGEWLALGGYAGVQIRHRDGRDPLVLPVEYRNPGTFFVRVGFAPSGLELVTNLAGDLRVWSNPDGRELWKTILDEGFPRLFVRDEGFFTSTTVDAREVVRWSAFEEGEQKLVGSMEALNAKDVDRTGAELAYAMDRSLYMRSLRDWNIPPRLVGEHSARVLGVAFHPDGKSMAAADEAGEIRIWSTAGGPGRLLRTIQRNYTANSGDISFSPGGKWLGVGGAKEGRWAVHLWDLTAPPDAAPLEVRTDSPFLTNLAFDPTESWLVTTHPDHPEGSSCFWPLEGTYPRVLEGQGDYVQVAFTPDGTTLLSASGDDTLRAWPLDAQSGTESRILLRTPMGYPGFAIDPSGEHVALAANRRVLVVPLNGGPPRELEGFSEKTSVLPIAFSPGGRRVAAAGWIGSAAEKVVRVWDLESGAVKVLGPLPGAGDGTVGSFYSVEFVDEDQLFASSDLGLVLFDLRDGSERRIASFNAAGILSRAGRFVVTGGDEVLRFGLDGSEPTPVPSHPNACAVAVDPTATLLATASCDGVVRIGPISGADPHVFPGQERVESLAFSPDSRWIASASEDRTMLWPVPDVTRTPPHRRRYEELLRALRSWTNLRVVADVKSPNGWKLEVGPFPGWAKVPEW
jgi:WD40 repeat protein